MFYINSLPVHGHVQLLAEHPLAPVRQEDWQVPLISWPLYAVSSGVSNTLCTRIVNASITETKSVHLIPHENS